MKHRSLVLFPLTRSVTLVMRYVPQMKMARDPAENPFSLWSSVNLGATLCRKRAVSQRNTEAAQGTTEKKPRVELIDRISNIVSYKRDIDSIIFNL